jgi:hypothetical protein
MNSIHIVVPSSLIQFFHIYFLLLHVFSFFFFFFFFLKRYSLLRTLAFNAIFLHSDGLWALPACFYSHYICSLKPSLSIFYVAFLFSLFLPLWLLQSVVAFFQHDHTIPVAGTFFHLPGTELRGFSMTVQSFER